MSPVPPHDDEPELPDDAFEARFRQHVRRSLTATALLGLGAVLVMLGLLGGPTFLESRLWWGAVVALLVVGTVLALSRRAPGRQLKADSAARGVPLRHLQRRATPPRARLAIWTVLLIGWVAALFVVGSPALAAAELGGSTSRTTAVGARAWTPCSRCSQRAQATIVVPTGLRTVQLRGVSQDAAYYRAGIVVVYKTSDPGVAMAARDYADGTGPVPPLVVAISTTVFGVGTWALVRLPPRRRRS